MVSTLSFILYPLLFVLNHYLRQPWLFPLFHEARYWCCHRNCNCVYVLLGGTLLLPPPPLIPYFIRWAGSTFIVCRLSSGDGDEAIVWSRWQYSHPMTTLPPLLMFLMTTPLPDIDLSLSQPSLTKTSTPTLVICQQTVMDIVLHNETSYSFMRPSLIIIASHFSAWRSPIFPEAHVGVSPLLAHH